MTTPFTKEACDVAANLISPLHPPRVRLLLGHEFVEYPQQWVNGGEVPFWVYVPTLNGGTLTLDYSTQDNSKLADGAAVARRHPEWRRPGADI